MRGRGFFLWVLSMLASIPCTVIAQDASYRKGSYLYYGQPEIEDNSFFIEEAFNQRMGVLQHIFNVYVSDSHSRNITYAFTQEIPITDQGHQLSYTLNYMSRSSGDSSSIGSISGLSDIFISYRPLVAGADRWAMVIPRLSIILPTGKASDGLGSGAFGLQFNLAVTKRLSRKVITHYNLGCTSFFKLDHYAYVNGDQTLIYERNVIDQNAGLGVVWNVHPKVNFLLEGLAGRNGSILKEGNVGHEWNYVINPGIRFSINTKQMQLVPGFSFPVNSLVDTRPAMFFYFSIEPDYENYYRKKLRHD